MTFSPIGKYDILKLLDIDKRKTWGLIDGRGSSLNEHQLVMGIFPNQNLDFLAYNITTGERTPDFGLDGHIIAEVYEDVVAPDYKWTSSAAAIASVPILVATLQEIVDGREPHDPRVLAQAALQYIERIKNR